MASNSDGDDQSAVVLKCTDPHQPEPDSDYSEIEISTAEICSWDFPTILTHQIIVVKASRNRLIEHSSYFRGLLCGSFRESILDCVSIKWNLETFMIVLKFLFGIPVDVTSTNFLPLFERGKGLPWPLLDLQVVAKGKEEIKAICIQGCLHQFNLCILIQDRQRNLKGFPKNVVFPYRYVGFFGQPSGARIGSHRWGAKLTPPISLQKISTHSSGARGGLSHIP
ncbi:hypothetical protein RHMOL_Rhmol04G0231800 [Rhododendron molle]|uniref:Uncharacterized protein n=1 Tax=Rhododendron molle TaxID=49168 RepID=A0ACC0P5Z0_RHOML|nr:hypothetical protein RHMOL_Rhmol04G0231800 [Rhododendron molle]